MGNLTEIGFYIHIPWCVKKCPYCDFNSHRAGLKLPEEQYINQLINDLEGDLELINNRKINTIFIGGGTPSLFSAESIAELLTRLEKLLGFNKNLIEITLEANPNSADYLKFKAFKQAGVNRLSIGVQSFQEKYLKSLGRVHDGEMAKQAILAAQAAGFDRVNIDLMYGLPQQNVETALTDLELAVSFQPSHLSWYELTIEPNTVFYKYPPKLPKDNLLNQIETEGKLFLQQKNYTQYEVSAFCKNQDYSQHNLNYWQFGDYLGIGAGAHSKLTILNNNKNNKYKIYRFSKIKNPNDYLLINKNNKNNFIAESQYVTAQALTLEFMMNRLRLKDRFILKNDYEAYTSLIFNNLMSIINRGVTQGLLALQVDGFSVTPLGWQFLNDTVNLFNF